jgi:Arc/MetJ-type ribon-helix-helix transcriptional regulator
MNVTISPATQKLLEEHLKKGIYSSPDDGLNAALQTLAETEAEPLEELPPETIAAIERAEAQSARGEGIPLDQAFEQVRRKHFDH